MRQIKTDIRSLTYEQLEGFVQSQNLPAFRTEQIFRWLHSGAESFDEMTNLPKSLRKLLDERACIHKTAVYKKLASKQDGTVKYVFELYDGSFVETVVMKYEHGYSVCLSTQVGCRMGCGFCQSTRSGLIRNLEAGEILGQLLAAQRDMSISISNIVLMGIGEPLDNFDNVVSFLKIVNHPKGVNIGYRHISLSTCGLVDGIDKLAKLNFPITLSISLHAPTDEKRSSIMPINKKYNVNSLISACRRYQSKTGRRISFEYSVINGVNDSPDDAKRLFSLLSGIMYHINLIPVNKIENGKYTAPVMKRIESFRNLLCSMGAVCTIRRTLGADISASCGQLRSKYETERRVGN